RLIEGKQQRAFLVVLSPVVQVPVELEKLFVVLEHPLPDREQLAAIARDLAADGGGLPDGAEFGRLLDAAAGLTRYEAEGAFARALGNEAQRPTLVLDMGALYGSLVGSTEANVRQALKIVDAMAPCVCFVDEVEKSLAGLGSNGDSGVSSRLFGTVLSWLSDH